MAVPEDSYSVIIEGELKFQPEVENAETTKFSWKVNGVKKSDQKGYTFLHNRW